MTASPRLSAGLLLAALVAAAFFARPGANAPAAAAAQPITVAAPYTHENLTVYVVRGPDEFDAGNVMTLQEALDRGLAVVHETGNVNMLAVENRSDDQDLFLQSGDIVKGGQQDRLIANDMIVPAKSGKVPCPANCCEHSRWTGRGQEAATHFAKSTDFACGNDIKIANATGQQSAVWANVAKAQLQLSAQVGKPVNGAASPTSLQLALEDKDLQAKLAGYEQVLARAAGYPDAIGVVVAVNGKVIAADVYGSAKLFRKVWPKLLKSAAVDALAQLPKGEPPAAPPVAAAREFLASAAGQIGQPVGDLSRASIDQAIAVRLGLNNEAEIAAASLQVDVVQMGAEVQRPTTVSGVHPDATATALPDLGVIVLRSRSPAAEPQVQTALMDAAVAASGGQTGAVVGFGGFAGNSVATQPQTVNSGRGRNVNVVNEVNPNGAPPAPAAIPSQQGIVVVESQAPAQPGVTVHRSYLKK
jgi:hypothetical protein